MVIFRFEKLEVWQKAMDWAQEVYSVTREFPDDERYGLMTQVRRAAVSVPSNIAEGSGRSSSADANRFISIAYGSLMETICQLKLAYRLKYLKEDQLNKLESGAEEIARMLSGLKKSRS